MPYRETPETRIVTGFAGFLLFPVVSYRLTTYPDPWGPLWGLTVEPLKKRPPIRADASHFKASG